MEEEYAAIKLKNNQHAGTVEGVASDDFEEAAGGVACVPKCRTEVVAYEAASAGSEPAGEEADEQDGADDACEGEDHAKQGG